MAHPQWAYLHTFTLRMTLCVMIAAAGSGLIPRLIEIDVDVGIDSRRGETGLETVT